MSDKCSHCSTNEFMAERLEAYVSATNLLKQADLKSSDENPPYTSADILTLACFLLGVDDN